MLVMQQGERQRQRQLQDRVQEAFGLQHVLKHLKLVSKVGWERELMVSTQEWRRLLAFLHLVWQLRSFLPSHELASASRRSSIVSQGCRPYLKMWWVFEEDWLRKYPGIAECQKREVMVSVEEMMK